MHSYASDPRRAAGSEDRARSGAESRPHLVRDGRWPHELSHEPILRVSDVLAAVEREFPGLSASKLRFLDAQGLVVPHRTASGYRHYSPADVERVRYVLRQQRDHYLPLTVIAGALQSLDRGATTAGFGSADATDRGLVTREQLAAQAMCSVEFVDALTDAGLIHRHQSGLAEASAIQVARAAIAYTEAGGDIRAARVVFNAAEREAARANDYSQPLRARGEAEPAAQQVSAWTEAAIALYSASARAAAARQSTAS